MEIPRFWATKIATEILGLLGKPRCFMGFFGTLFAVSTGWQDFCPSTTYSLAVSFRFTDAMK